MEKELRAQHRTSHQATALHWHRPSRDLQATRAGARAGADGPITRLAIAKPGCLFTAGSEVAAAVATPFFSLFLPLKMERMKINVSTYICRSDKLQSV